MASDPLAGLPEEAKQRFNNLVAKAKQLSAEGEVKMALELSKKAHAIFPSEKLGKKIEKMKAFLEVHGSDEDEEDDGMTHVGNGFYLYYEMYNKLYRHQKEGVLWLWNLFKKKKGGILGDDMGLGKTIQVIAYLSGVFDAQEVKNCLLVMPVSVIPNWEREFDKWAPGIPLNTFHGNSKKERERVLYRTQRRGGVLLTSYGMVVSSSEQLANKDDREFVWDYVILDEGHKIKNPTKTSKGIHSVPARNRIILTGTPIQNNLQELWALFDFVQHGRLLGTRKTFKMEYQTPITRSREKDATAGEKRLGQQMAESLKRIIGPYFLQRTKAQVNKENKENNDPNEKSNSAEAVMPTLTRKNDLVVWLSLTDTQIKIYRDFSEQDSIKELLMTSKSPLVALTVLKKICDHPRLMTTLACRQLGLATSESQMACDSDDESSRECAANQVMDIPISVLQQECGKLCFVVRLLDQLKMEGHRCLIFSQSRKMLDIIQRVLREKGHKIMRLDGTVKFTSEREELVQKFQRDSSYNVFLLTTQVGGVGLTLTGADRVIIFDPSWNPATDAQAVDRVFRIGQDKNVVIYRLITCGTVEEKIYRRQIFKDSINKQTTGKSNNPYRYFSSQELRELFQLDDPHHSTTQLQLQDMHGNHRKTDDVLDHHLAFLYSLDIFGISDHDLMFSQEPDDIHSGEEEEGHNNYIESRVLKAQQLITMEADQAAKEGGFSRMRSPDQPKVARPPGGSQRYREWQMPPQATREPEEEEERIDLGDLDTSQIDDEEINRTMEELTLESGPRKMKTSPSSKKEQQTNEKEVIEIVDSAENSMIETFEKPASHSKLGASPDAPIGIDSESDSDIFPETSQPKPFNQMQNLKNSSLVGAKPSPLKNGHDYMGIDSESDDDDLPEISRPKSRNQVQRLNSSSESFDGAIQNPLKDIPEDEQSPPRVDARTEFMHDAEMASPAPRLRSLASPDIEMDSPLVAWGKLKKKTVLDSDDEGGDYEMASPAAVKQRSLATSDVEMNSPFVARGKLKNTVLDSEDDAEDSELAAVKQRSLATTDVEMDSPIVAKGKAKKRIVLDSDDEEEDAELALPSRRQRNEEYGDVDGESVDEEEVESEVEEEEREGEEDVDVEREDDKGEDEELGDEDEFEVEGRENMEDEEEVPVRMGRERVDDEEEDGEEEEEDDDEQEEDEELGDEDEVEVEGRHDTEDEEEVHMGREQVDDDEEDEELEAEGDDEDEVDVQSQMKELKLKIRHFVTSQQYKKAIPYAVKALSLDSSDKQLRAILENLKKKCQQQEEEAEGSEESEEEAEGSEEEEETDEESEEEESDDEGAASAAEEDIVKAAKEKIKQLCSVGKYREALMCALKALKLDRSDQQLKNIIPKLKQKCGL